MIAIDLSGKVALVTGGSRGIGAGITETLCRAGASVVFTHTGNPVYRDRLEELLARIRKEGGSARAVVLDARDAAKSAKNFLRNRGFLCGLRGGKRKKSR